MLSVLYLFDGEPAFRKSLILLVEEKIRSGGRIELLCSEAPQGLKP